jgi:hypothetical protein
MDSKVIQYIDSNRDELLPFDNIFGDKLRIVIPMIGSEIYDKLMEDLNNIPNIVDFDRANLEIIQRVKLDPKYGHGDSRERRVKLGKAIQDMNIPDDKNKRYLDWYAKYKEFIPKMWALADYLIILSRAPVDLVRMSDYTHIDSCHKRGNSHFQCAVEEAINGGAIAYLVYKDSLENIDESELQDDDLFSDRDRGFDGIKDPVSRVRIRNVKSNYSGVEVAIPELRIYGNTNVPTFYESVVDFLKTQQSVDLKQFTDYNNTLVGGSYEDNNMHDLINSYLGLTGDKKVSAYDINVEVPDNKKEEEMIHLRFEFDLRKELQDIEDNYSYNEAISPSFYVHEEEYDMYDMRADVKFDLSSYALPEDFDITIDDIYEVKRELKKETPIGKFLAKLYETLANHSVYITRIEADTDELKLEVRNNPYDEINSDSDNYDTFCSNLRDLDNDWNNVEGKIQIALIDSGIISGEYSRIQEYMDMDGDDQKQLWKNLEIRGFGFSDFDVSFVKQGGLERRKLIMLRLTPEISKRLYTGKLEEASFVNNVKSALWKFSVDNFKPTSNPNDDDQLNFSSFFESFTKQSWTNDIRYKDFDFDLNKTSSSHFEYPNSLFISRLTITPNNWSNLVMEYFDFMNDHFDIIINLIRFLVVSKLIDTYENTDLEMVDAIKKLVPNFANMQRVFGKYVLVSL